MKKKLTMLLLAIITIGFVSGQTLRFRKDGTFKIAQFTDVHFKADNPASDSALVMINEVLDSEKPDLVILSGDIVTGEFEGWAKIIEPMQRRNIPFAAVMGNHDDEQKTSRKDILEYLEKQPMSLTKKGDYVLSIGANEALIYMFDSNSYSTRSGVDGYGWFSFDQIQNYINTSRRFARQDAAATPALAFFHIPLPEYTQAFNSRTYPPLGQRNEDECSPKINTGMFAAMRLAGDVMGCFVGHDHINDYMAYHYDIALAYGRFSGGKTTYGDLLNGSRIITLHQGIRKFDTHLRLRGGATEQYAQFPRKMNLAITNTYLFSQQAELFRFSKDQSAALGSMAYLDGVVLIDGATGNKSRRVLEAYETISAKPVLYTSPVFINNDKKIMPLENLDENSYAGTRGRDVVGLHKASGSYSWNLNGVHFVQCNITNDHQTNAKMIEWFTNDMKKYGSQPSIMLAHQVVSPGSIVISVNAKTYERLIEAARGHKMLATFSDIGFSNETDIKHYTLDSEKFYLLVYDKLDGLKVTESSWNERNKTLDSKILN